MATMKLVLTFLLVCTSVLGELTNYNGAMIEKRAKNGRPRACDYSTGHSVPWDDVKNAARQWCSNHANKEVPLGGKIEDGSVENKEGTRDKFKSGRWRVKMHVKYQNDHADPSWTIDEADCNWYLLYIAQGCTKGGDRPSDKNDQVSDGGTFYEELMGSVDWRWERVGDIEL